ncbi:general substrate transporter [Violaceomyces palustris]|uniref:General substrate transporter n=1 Tax=Violaceomyces palustris TaxID=1673888 RepID=A0ACD0P0B9_9BASI|nr:general substrate transporter [Violaceomyces palustris]
MTSSASTPIHAASQTSSTTTGRPRTTRIFTLSVLWIIISAFEYGYGISELNPLQPILTCQTGGDPLDSPSTTKSCSIRMTESEFGLVTSLFTLGGLISSFALPAVSARLGLGRRLSIRYSALLNVLGGLMLASAQGIFSLGTARFVQGLASGVGVVIVPIYLSELAPTSMRGSIGVLNQLSIVLGIFTAQALGASRLGESPTEWRWVPTVAFLLAMVQLVVSFWSSVAVESPRWLEEGEGKAKGSTNEARRIRSLLWSREELEEYQNYSARFQDGGGSVGGTRRGGGEREGDEEDILDERERLLEGERESGEIGEGNQQSAMDVDRPIEVEMGLKDLFKDDEIRPGVLMVILTQLAQQFSGVNSVLFYSTGIMSTVLPSLASSIGLVITVINILMTFPPILLISESRMGRKKLMMASSLGMCLSCLLLGLGIMYDWPIVSAICIVLVVASFSIGLGPVPFVILPELVPLRAVSKATSLGLTLNWTANTLVGTLFHPIRNLLSHLDNGKGGAVFWLFAFLNLVSFTLIGLFYRFRLPVD